MKKSKQHTCSQELVEDSLPTSSSGMNQSSQSSGIPTPAPSCGQDSPECASSKEMCAPWTSKETWLASMQSALASLVKTYQRLEREKVYREAGLDCTGKSSEQLTMYDLLGCSSKTHLQSALEAVTSSSAILWREDIPGETEELPQLMLARHTNENDGFYWLTPRIVEIDETPENFRNRMNSKRKNDRKNGMGSLTMQVKYCPLREQIGASDGGPLNPEWVEWLMGWPIGHTELLASEMDKFRSRPRSRGKSSEVRK